MAPEFAQFQWRGRTTIICFDSDAATKPQVQQARVRLAARLVQLGAQPLVVDLPSADDEKKVGLDDYLQARKTDAAAIKDLRALAKHVDSNFEALAEIYEFYVYVKRARAIWDIKENQFFRNAREWHLHLANKKLLRFTSQGAKEICLDKLWEESASRREVRDLTYAPGQPTDLPEEDKLNLWVDTRPEAKKGDVSAFYELLDHHGIQGAERKPFVQWCAYPFTRHPFKNPNRKTQWAVLLWGAQGSGKTLLGELVSACYGLPLALNSNVSHIRSTRELHSGFNKLLLNKQFIVANEVMSHDRRAEAEFLKDLITGSTINAREMYKDSYTLPNHANLFFTSNHPNALYLERDERHYLIFESEGGDLATTNHQLYQKLQGWHAHGRGLASSNLRWHFEREVDMRGFDPDKKPIETAALRQMTADADTPIMAALRQIKEDPNLSRIGQLPMRRLFRLEEISAMVVRRGVRPDQVYPSAVRVANDRIQAFKRLPEVALPRKQRRKGTSAHMSLWCHANDFTKLAQLPAQELLKMYDAERPERKWELEATAYPLQ